MAEELRLLTVHAHCDDESITMGGLLAVLGDDPGVRTALVTCTDGQLATIVDLAMDEVTTRPILGQIRREEMRRAAAVLGIDELHFLGYRDSGMAGAATNHDADAFWSADIDAVVRRLVERLRAFRPHVVVTYDANGGYGHPDHIQAHRATLLAVEAAGQRGLYPDLGELWRVSKLYYTAFPASVMRRVNDLAEASGMPSPFGFAVDTLDLPFVTPDELVSAEIDVRDGVLRKREALRQHRSQITEEWPLLALPEELALEHFRHEHFQRVLCRVAAPLPEDDLFAGLR